MSSPAARLALIVAVSRNGVIGREGKLPWRIPEDMQRFRQLTMGQPVLMGRKTWDSLPTRFKPLPGRPNIVLSRHPTPDYGGQGQCYLACDLESALRQAQELVPLSLMPNPMVWVIGGDQTYHLTLPLASHLELTLIDADIDGDAFFPELPARQWRISQRQDSLISQSGLSYTFLSYERVGTDLERSCDAPAEARRSVTLSHPHPDLLTAS